jgi:uncharacterized protein (DUF302 family)
LIIIKCNSLFISLNRFLNMYAEGVITQQVNLLPDAAIDFIEKTLRQNGATIYARINQQEEAGKNGINIRPLVFLLFGNPAKGGKVMLENPVAALDLPLKIIAWQDESNNNYIAFNDVKYLAQRYNLSNNSAMLINVAIMLSGIIKQML